MDRTAAHTALDQILTDATGQFAESHPGKLEQLAAHIATCHMVVDDLFDTTEYVPVA